MDEHDQHPKSGATRGAGDWPYEFPRCVDCPQFTTLSERLSDQEATLKNVNTRLHAVERKQDAHGKSLEGLSKEIGRVVRWLDGSNGSDGFRVEWALLSTGFQKGISIRERLAWLLGGLLGAAMLGLIGKVLLDAIQRGVTP